MSYVIEGALEIYLDLKHGHSTGSATSITIVFDDDAEHPPLPWALPTITVSYSAPLQTAGASAAEVTSFQADAERADSSTPGGWETAVRGDGSVSAAHQLADFSDGSRAAAFCAATPLQSFLSGAWGYPGARDDARAGGWGEGTAKQQALTSGWIMQTPARDKQRATPFFSVNLSGSPYDDDAATLRAMNADDALRIGLQLDGPMTYSDPLSVALRFGFAPLRRPSVPHDITLGVTARAASDRDRVARLPWGDGQSAWNDWNLPYPVEDDRPPSPEPADPPERRVVYLTMNTLQITDIATGTPLDIQGVTISLDIDSISWKFSGTAYGQGSLDLVRPDESGMSDIEVVINGHRWIFSIDSYSSDEKFPTQKFTLSGLSRTQYMASPFAPARSLTNTVATTAAQAASAELENTGFSLDWPTGDDQDLPDWPLSAGTLSYREKSPAQVIGQIVGAAGGVMIPHMADDGWTIQPRYRTPPWQWDSATPDAAIYIGMIRSRSARYEPSQACDACFVSGINHGVSVDVQLTGSGGLNPMPDVFDDLITAPAVAISRGKNELSATGSKVIEILSVIIPESKAAPGILLPGQIVRITHDDELKDYTALVLSVSISAQRAGAAEIYQSVTLERRA